MYNFTIRYINNTLTTRKNMARWGLSQSPDCSFCLNPESLPHVVAGCQQYLDRFTRRYDSILNFIAKSLQPVINVHSSLYADVNEGEMVVYGIAVLCFFSCGISVILILTCSIVVSSSAALSDFSSFWLTVFGKIRLFTVLRYRLFELSFRYNTQNKTQLDIKVNKS